MILTQEQIAERAKAASELPATRSEHFTDWWRGLAKQGDPQRRQFLTSEAYDAGMVFGGVLASREYLDTLEAAQREVGELVEALQLFLDITDSASYCEACQRHAPKDSLTGDLVGVVDHIFNCPVPNAKTLIAKHGGGSNG